MKSTYQAARMMTTPINELLNLQSTGHGRTLPTGVTAEAARYVIREATHVAELMLATHDRQMGASQTKPPLEFPDSLGRQEIKGGLALTILVQPRVDSVQR